MSFMPARGTALRTHRIRVRFAPGARPGPKPADLDVAEVRKLLRTDMSIEQIALHLGVKDASLRSFIKRRNLGDMWARRVFLSMQEALRKEEIAKPISQRGFKAREL